MFSAVTVYQFGHTSNSGLNETVLDSGYVAKGKAAGGKRGRFFRRKTKRVY